MLSGQIRDRLHVMLVLLAMSTAVPAEEVSERWQKVGSATLSVLWFDIYDASLYSLSGQFRGYDEPLLFQLDYKREISQKALLEETEKQWSRYLPGSHPQKRWLSLLKKIWPEIRKGDQLALELTPEGESNFYHNRMLIGVITDQQFAPSFLQIWLSTESQYPELAKQLRGEQR